MVGTDLKDADYAALAEFRYRLRAFLAFSEERARAAGLTPPQQQLLLAVRGFGKEGPSVRALAARLFLRHHSVVELVDRLERRGLVRRRRSSSDRRLVYVDLTPRGARLLGRLTLAHRAELQRKGPDLAVALASLLEPRRSLKRRRASRTR